MTRVQNLDESSNQVICVGKGFSGTSSKSGGVYQSGYQCGKGFKGHNFKIQTSLAIRL